LLAVGALTACADKQVTVRNQPDPTLERLIAPNALTIFNFSDQRGSEGDHDIFRVGTSAHISGDVRLYDRQGSILVEKRISERQTWDLEMGAGTSEEALQATLNRALAGFVSKIVTDSDIDSVLTRPSKRP
jgi:hypothetical protein